MTKRKRIPEKGGPSLLAPSSTQGSLPEEQLSTLRVLESLLTAPLSFSTSPLILEGDLDLSNLPPESCPVRKIAGCIIKGNLTLGDYPHLEELDCVVEGEVEASSSNLVRLGENLRVAGNFTATECGSLEIVQGSFGGDLSLRSSTVVRVLSGTTIAGDLDVRGCKFLKDVGGRVTGDFLATDSDLECLLPGFRCSGEVNLGNCPNLRTLGFIGRPTNVCMNESGLEVLEAGFECTGSMFAFNVPRLTKVGDRGSVRIGGDLVMGSCRKLASVSGLKVGRTASISTCPLLSVLCARVKGNLVISQCGLLVLGETLEVGADLLIEECPKLTKICSSSQAIEVRRLPLLREFGETLECQGDMVVEDCPFLRKISGALGGSLLIFGAAEIPFLDQSLRVKGDLRVASSDPSERKNRAFSNISIGEINCQVGGEVTIQGASLGGFGRDFSCGSLFIIGSTSDFRLRGFVRGQVGLTRCSVSVIGADFECGGGMSAQKCHALHRLNCTIGGDLLLFETPRPSLMRAFCCAGSVQLINSVSSPSKSRLKPSAKVTVKKSLSPRKPQRQGRPELARHYETLSP